MFAISIKKPKPKKMNQWTVVGVKRVKKSPVLVPYVVATEVELATDPALMREGLKRAAREYVAGFEDLSFYVFAAAFPSLVEGMTAEEAFEIDSIQKSILSISVLEAKEVLSREDLEPSHLQIKWAIDRGFQGSLKTTSKISLDMSRFPYADDMEAHWRQLVDRAYRHIAGEEYDSIDDLDSQMVIE